MHAWQEARAVVLGTIDLARTSWKPYASAVFSQLQRASLSVQLNIAEGYAFGESPSFTRHLAIAYGSAVETGELLEIALDAAHERAYGYAAAEDAVELVNVRLAAIGVTPRPRRAPLQAGGREPGAALKGTREVWFAEGWRKTGVFDRAKLLGGNVIAGPAIVEEPDASTLVHPGWEAAVDQHGNLLMHAVA